MNSQGHSQKISLKNLISSCAISALRFKRSRLVSRKMTRAKSSFLTLTIFLKSLESSSLKAVSSIRSGLSFYLPPGKSISRPLKSGPTIM
jgi:hypothetical protein